MFFCKSCNTHVKHYSSHKKSNIHKSNCLLKTQFENVNLIASAFKNRIATYKISPEIFTISPEDFLTDISQISCHLIKQMLEKFTTVKVNFELYISYILPKNGESSLKSFNTKYEVIYQNTDILCFYKRFITPRWRSG